MHAAAAPACAKAHTGREGQSAAEAQPCWGSKRSWGSRGRRKCLVQVWRDTWRADSPSSSELSFAQGGLVAWSSEPSFAGADVRESQNPQGRGREACRVGRAARTCVGARWAGALIPGVGGNQHTQS